MAISDSEERGVRPGEASGQKGPAHARPTNADVPFPSAPIDADDTAVYAPIGTIQNLDGDAPAAGEPVFGLAAHDFDANGNASPSSEPEGDANRKSESVGTSSTPATLEPDGTEPGSDESSTKAQASAEAQAPDGTKADSNAEAAQPVRKTPRHFRPGTEPPEDEEDESSDGWEQLSKNELGSPAEEQTAREPRWQDVKPTVRHGEKTLKHTRGWYQVVVVLLVMVVVVAGVAAGVTYSLELWGGKSVPSVTGLVSARAAERLEEKGFSVAITYVTSDNGDDRVISSDPSVGTRVEEGSTVTLTVGQARTIPGGLVGSSVQDARAALEGAGATNVQLNYQSSSEAEGTVLAVSPGEGVKFSSSDPVTLTIAQLPKVPDVVGRSLSDALKTLDSAGLTPTVEYVTSGAHKKGYVESTTPSAGRRANEKGAVTVHVVSPLPSDAYHVAEYLDALPAALSDFLQKAGYTATYGEAGGMTEDASASGATDADGTADTGGNTGGNTAVNRLVQCMASSNGDSIVISATPWQIPATDAASSGSDGASDVLADATSLDGLGVCLRVAAAQCPQTGATVGTMRQVMALCGLEGDPTVTCDETSAQFPSGSTASGLDFYSAYGEQGDYAWDVVVSVNADKAAEAAVVYAPKTVFEAVDTSTTGGSVASYLAWALLAS